MGVYQFTRAISSGLGSASAIQSLTMLTTGSIGPLSVANGADQLHSCSIDFSQLAGLFILSSGDLTLETNSSGAPADTIALLANLPYMWHTSWYDACLITEDVTAIYLTNATGAVVTFQMYWGYTDATP